jgi:hypothetical protein
VVLFVSVTGHTSDVAQSASSVGLPVGLYRLDAWRRLVGVQPWLVTYWRWPCCGPRRLVEAPAVVLGMAGMALCRNSGAGQRGRTMLIL